jgi:hypothetical protein
VKRLLGARRPAAAWVLAVLVLMLGLALGLLVYADSGLTKK